MQKTNHNNTQRPTLWPQILIAALTLAAVAAILLLSRQTYRETRELAVEQFNQQQLILARSAAAGIESYYQELSQALVSLAKQPSIQQMAPECLQCMQHTYWGFPPRTSIRLLDKDGVLRYIYPFEGWRGELIGKDYSQEAYFQDARNIGNISISGLTINEQGDARIRIAVPVYLTHGEETLTIGDETGVIITTLDPGKSESGSFQWILVGSFELKVIDQSFVSHIVSGQTGYAWLLNEGGIYLAHHEQEFVGLEASEVRAVLNPDISYEGIEQIQRRMLAGEEGTGRYISGWHRGQVGEVEKLVAYTPVHVNGHIWSVAVCAPVSEVAAIVRTAHLAELYTQSFIIVTLIAVGVYLLIISRRWSQSLEREVEKRTGQLRESEERFRTIFENTVIGLYRTTPDGRILMSNPAMVRMLGYSSFKEFSQRNLEKDGFESGYSRSIFQQRIESQGQIIGLESAWTRHDGSTLFVRESAQAIRDEAGNILYYEGTAEDITERKQAEQTLLESEERYRTTFEATGTAVVIIEEDTSISLANAEFLELSGYSKDEVEGKKNWTEFVAQEDLERMKENHRLRRTAEKAAPRNYEFRFIDRWGNAKDAFLTIAMIPGTQKSVASLLDITERVQAEDDLQRRHSELALLNRVITTASTTLEPNAVLETTCRELALAFDLPQAAAALLNEARTATVVVAEYLEGGRPSALDIVIPVEGNPTMQYILEHRVPVAVVDAKHDPRMVAIHDVMRQRGTVSMLILPLMVRDKVVGTLGLDAVERREFSSEEIDLAASAAAAAAQALENARLFSQANRWLKHLEALHTIDQTILASMDLNMIGEVIIKQAQKQLGVDAVDILVFDPALQSLHCAARRGFKSQALAFANLRLGSGLAGKAVLARKVLSIPDLEKEIKESEYAPELRTEGFMAYWGVPLIAKGKIQGVLELFHRTPLEPDDEWFKFMSTLAGQAAIAIDNANLFENLQKKNMELNLAYDTTLEGWAHALELHDIETEGHSRRVTEMTLRLAKDMGIDRQVMIHIRRGALLHDIGKMGIPDSILNKPGPLTDEEWEVMCKHPAYSYEMLSSIPFLRPAIDIPYSHHEKWDGSGYPLGLRGDSIPLPARIFAIIDVWDALNSDRPYRKAWPEDKVLDYIREQSGIHFDPQVVEAFLVMISKTR